LASELDKSKRERESELGELILDTDKIDKILARHQYDRSSLIQMLIDLQIEYNWLPQHALFYVGKKIDIPLSQVYSIASFYKFFNLVPKGKYQIVVCAGTACHVRGSMNLLQRAVNILKIKPGDTTPDYRFTLDTVNCLGCCALGHIKYGSLNIVLKKTEN
jgi:NADH-quinone oxidoreductase subunit E